MVSAAVSEHSERSNAISAYVKRHLAMIGTNKTDLTGYEGGGVAAMAHTMLKNARARVEWLNAREMPIAFESDDGEAYTWCRNTVAAMLDFYRGGCDCSVCVEYGGDCPVALGMSDKFDRWAKYRMRIMRADKKGNR